MSSRTLPPALEPYLKLPPEFSQILLTSTLGCSINWLTARFVSTVLNPTSKEPHDEANPVILVSWLRSSSFWINEIRRTTGLDLSKPQYKTRYIFIDTFSSAQTLAETQKSIESAISSLSQTTAPASPLPNLDKITNPKPLLLLDSPHLLLATSQTTSQPLQTLLLTLRSQVHATIVSCNIDLPLVSAAVSATTMGNSFPSGEHRITPVETETAAFVVQQAHLSRVVMGVRELETGAAKDVSGVLRVTRGGRGYDSSSSLVSGSANRDGGKEQEAVKEAEFLYLVQRDGNVKVFSRGSEG